MPEQVYKTDVLIIGGGLAGIATATELLDSGHTILILDRDDEDAFGGLARWSFGGIFLVDTREQRRLKVSDSAELAYRDWVRTGELQDGDALVKEWARLFVEQCTEDVGEWLRQRSIKFFPVVHWVERGLYEPGNSVPRFHMVWGTGHRLVEVLASGLRRHQNAVKLDLKFRHNVTRLLVQGGRVSGAHGFVEPDGVEFRVEADAVVVAAGGYCGNEQWLRDNWDNELGPAPETILNGSHRFATGALHQATETAGGVVTNRQRAWYYAAGVHHPSPRHRNHGLSIVPPKSALWLDPFGRRIGPEPLVSGFDTRDLVSRICRVHRGFSWQVMNWKIACKELAVSGSEFNDAIRERNLLRFLRTVLVGNGSLIRRLADDCDDFVVADTPHELAAGMNALARTSDVDPEVLTQTIEEYDERVARGGSLMNDEQLRRIAHLRRYRGDRVRTSKSQRILDPSALPLIAIREFVLSRKSLGGIRTDTHSRVLSKYSEAGGSSRTPVAGLYAVGEAAGFGGGGIHGKRSLEGTFLGACILTGRIAGKSIAGGG